MHPVLERGLVINLPNPNPLMEPVDFRMKDCLDVTLKIIFSDSSLCAATVKLIFYKSCQLNLSLLVVDSDLGAVIRLFLMGYLS